jgi:hypothetical protein
MNFNCSPDNPPSNRIKPVLLADCHILLGALGVLGGKKSGIKSI